MNVAITRTLFMTLLITALAAGCGWQLRGKGMLPEGLDRLHVVSRDSSGDLARELSRALASAGVEVVDSTADAELSLVILQERSLVRVATVNEQARVSEQELSEKAAFTVLNRAGETVLARSVVSVERIFEYDENNVLATQDERELLRREMRRDLVNQILNRLRQLKPVPEGDEAAG